MEEAVDNPAEVAQTERIGLGDLVISSVLGIVVFLGLKLWEFPGLLPALWDDAVVASGVRPAVHVMPGFWMALARQIYSACGVAGAEPVLRLLGHVALAGMTACVYAILRELLAFVMRARPQYSRRRTLVMQVAAALGALAFAVTDPVWMAGQCLSETTILLLLTMGAIEAFLVFLRKGTLKYSYICSVFLGLLAAETPVGFVLPIVFISFNVFVIGRIPALESPFFKPAVLEVGKWHMTFLYLVSLIGGVTLNCWTYVSGHGLGAIGETVGSIPLAYAVAYWNRFIGAADPAAWLLWTGITLAPAVVAAIRFPRAADEEQFLPYTTGMVFFFCGLLAFSQCAALPALWFWTHFPVDSSYLLSLGMFCCSVTLAGALTTLGVDGLCRNHQRLARVIFGNDEDEESGVTVVSHATTLLRRVGLVVVPVTLVVLMVPGRVKTTMRIMQGVLLDALAETVREAGDATYLFTDGQLDTGVELAGARVGKKVLCESLMGGEGPMNGFLRVRGLTDDEDRFAFGYDAGMGLRTWIRDRPDRLKSAAVQMGFDLWKRDGKSLPPMGGLLSRPSGFPSEDERRAGVAQAGELANRVLAVHARRSGLKVCTDAALRKAFLAVQWRLARMCTYRGEWYDLAGEAESAIRETRLAKELNDRNEIYQELVRSLEKRNELLMQKLTPREGLQLALVRADFTLGRTYAEKILGAEPENPDANFALGMYYLKEKQLSRAEIYLKRCLVRRPNEPAVYNNLAMIQIELRKFAAAEANVRKALELAPGSAAILDTQKALERARNPSAKMNP